MTLDGGASQGPGLAAAAIDPWRGQIVGRPPGAR